MERRKRAVIVRGWEEEGMKRGAQRIFTAGKLFCVIP